ncbi:MAG: DNRLRE domain-containing protein [Anaerolineae bacterium]|nr:DNRLRE domain-containing protein [Anaerolineae bacterium]
MTVYLDLDGNIGNAPDNNSYRFVAQLNNPPQDRTNHQVAYRGNGSGWTQASVSFESLAGWVGTNVNNNNGEDRGWQMNIEIPFSSLGLSGRPADGVVWGLGTAVHDRDSANGSPAIPNQVWPETMNSTQPTSWGQLHFGLPGYSSPAAPQGTTTIKHGQNGAVVTDAQVGGYFDCGEPYNPNFFNGWGDANYYNRGNRDQVNVQNQANLGDWPCFSKTYISFPLSQIPANKQIISAELTLNHFGNSNPAQAMDSLIHVLTVGESWTEQTITWNNAPLALENQSVTRVAPLPSFPGWPGVPRHWDVSRAVAQAYATGQPLRLALYSTDFAMHSGKYFYSSDADSAGRPTLVVTWGQ